VLSNADNRVNLVASANNQAIFSADFDAQVDPVISFDPGFDATGFSIEVSEGVGNTVPEPGAALMTLAGAGVLLLVRRGRRSRAPA
jgi:PEP-CTERM motif-containing protein